MQCVTIAASGVQLSVPYAPVCELHWLGIARCGLAWCFSGKGEGRGKRISGEGKHGILQPVPRARRPEPAEAHPPAAADVAAPGEAMAGDPRSSAVASAAAEHWLSGSPSRASCRETSWACSRCD